MKKILKGIFVLMFVFLLSACAKDYKAITYSKFNEFFQAEEGYLVNNTSNIYNDKVERFAEASGKNNQFLYYEFKSEKDAREYVTLNYKDKKDFKYKDKKDYITVKVTKNKYFNLIQVGKVVIIGNTDIKSNKKEINRVFKELGY